MLRFWLLNFPAFQYFSRPSQFKPSHTHTDVRLVLGWTSSLLALGASFYAYKVPFQQSRQWVLLAVLVFVVCSAVLGAYGKWIEKDTIFIGRRKVYAGRVRTQQEYLFGPNLSSFFACLYIYTKPEPNPADTILALFPSHSFVHDSTSSNCIDRDAINLHLFQLHSVRPDLQPHSILRAFKQCRQIAHPDCREERLEAFWRAFRF